MKKLGIKRMVENLVSSMIENFAKENDKESELSLHAQNGKKHSRKRKIRAKNTDLETTDNVEEDEIPMSLAKESQTHSLAEIDVLENVSIHDLISLGDDNDEDDDTSKGGDRIRKIRAKNTSSSSSSSSSKSEDVINNDHTDSISSNNNSSNNGSSSSSSGNCVMNYDDANMGEQEEAPLPQQNVEGNMQRNHMEDQQLQQQQYQQLFQQHQHQQRPNDEGSKAQIKKTKAAARMKRYRADHKNDPVWVAKEASRKRNSHKTKRQVKIIKASSEMNEEEIAELELKTAKYNEKEAERARKYRASKREDPVFKKKDADRMKAWRAKIKAEKNAEQNYENMPHNDHHHPLPVVEEGVHQFHIPHQHAESHLLIVST